MIPTTNKKLLAAEDWTKIYQTYRNADFKSYDFETIRRTMISYLREKYPEDFNDYIDSSEYIALIDLIAFLGQSISFRVDLNARENFLETASRRDSVIRLARLINYNVKRNTPANGFLKITAVQTTDNVIDSSGVNLVNQAVTWNDPTNTNWYQQFISVLNSAMPGSFVFGNPFDRAIIDGIPTEQYKLNSANTDVPVYSFNRAIDGISTDFEIVSSTFANKTYIYEDTPSPANSFSMIFRNDGRGNGSSNSGFFVHFRQGSLRMSSFTIDTPVPNEIVGVDAPDINDTDVWLWQLDSSGNYSTLWTKVDSTVGNNAIYNNVSLAERNIYVVATRENDQIDLNFADGAFGNLPKGTFNLFYRQSNGSTYSITPDQLRGIQVTVPYYNKYGQPHTLTLTLSLQYTVNNSSGSESNSDIKIKAPQAYYTQNRMITAEDYNIAPLLAGTDILKVKSVNRTASGISKYFELSDVSGKYSSTNIYGTDGALYKNDTLINFEFSFSGTNDIYSMIKSQLADAVSSNRIKNFYFDKWSRPSVADISSLEWKRITKSTNQSTGYLQEKTDPYTPQTVGYYASNNLQYFYTGALVKVLAPITNNKQQYFKRNGELSGTTYSSVDVSWKDYKWVKIIKVVGDGANSGQGVLADGTGPVILSDNIPTGATISEIIPEFVSTLPTGVETEIVNLCSSNRNFGLGFTVDTRAWYIITDTNLDLSSPFSLLYQKDSTNANKDASWLISFEWTGINYKVQYRATEYIFESENETAFFIDPTSVNYDFINNSIIKDKISVLGINSVSTASNSLGIDYLWQLDDSIVEIDGYVNPKKVSVSYYDKLDTNEIDNPDSFINIVNPEWLSADTGYKDKFVYFKLNSDESTYSITDSEQFYAYPAEENVPVGSSRLHEGKLFYFYNDDVDVVKQYNTSTNTFDLLTNYYAKPGRTGLKFHYQHNSGDDRRIDPSKTNIIDIYVLNKTYDTQYRNWLAAGSGSEPLPPTSSSLEENYNATLESMKAISDELIFQPVKYKPLFGSSANSNLQATFKVVKNSSRSVSDNDVKTRVLTAIENFFALENWDFGQTFHFSELTTYVMNSVTPDVTTFVIVPKSDNAFGSLYEISCASNEIFISAATVDDIEIISSVTTDALKASSTIVTSSGV